MGCRLRTEWYSDGEPGSELQALGRHHLDNPHWFWQGTFSPDGARILTPSAENAAKLWDAASGKLIASFPHQGSVWHGAFSSDGARILTASTDKTAKLWDAASGKLIVSFAHQDAVTNVGFSPDGARILTVCADNTAKLWDVASGKLIASFAHQSGDWVRWAAFSPDGARILTIGPYETDKLWDVTSGKLIASFDHPSLLYYAAFSPDGTRILTAGTDDSAKLWDAASGKLVASFAHKSAVFYAAFSPDGARILTASWDKTAKLWDAASGKLVASFDQPSWTDPWNGGLGAPEGLRDLYHAGFSPDGARILTTSRDNTAKLWDAASGKLIASFDHQDTVRLAAFSPDGARIVTPSWDKTAKLWDVATPVELARQMKESGGNTARTGFSVSMAGSLTLQVESLSDIASGFHFSDEGSLVAVNEERRSQLTKQLKDLAQEPSSLCALHTVVFQYRR